MYENISSLDVLISSPVKLRLQYYSIICTHLTYYVNDDLKINKIILINDRHCNRYFRCACSDHFLYTFHPYILSVLLPHTYRSRNNGHNKVTVVQSVFSRNNLVILLQL
jgi:hypothetical protein